MASSKLTAIGGILIRINTNSFMLYSLGVADATPELLAWFNRKELLQGLNLPIKAFTLEALQQMLATFDNVHHYLVGIFSPDSQLVGFYAVDVNHLHRAGNITAGLGANLPASYTGKQILWATIDALVEHFFE